MARQTTRPQRDWALYDWANSAFATTVMAGFFPLFFKQYWADGLSVTDSTFWLGAGNSAASLLVLLAAPLLGALADARGTHRRQLALFAASGILATAAFFFISRSQWEAAIALYAIAVIGFSSANVFYDALLPEVAGRDERHRVSAFGQALGYLGGGLLFLVNVVMTLKPGWFGLADAGVAVRVSFLSVAVWWAVFSIPLLRSGPRKTDAGPARAVGTGSGVPFGRRLREALRDLRCTLGEIRAHRNLWLFLIGYWFYIDGVATIIRMAVDYGMAIGLPANSLITALLLVQFIGFPATIAFGRLGTRIGPRRALMIALWVYLLATIAASVMSTALEFYLLAGVLGLVQGGVQALSRSLFSQLIPEHRSGQYFGFLNMIGKAAAVLGPVLVGTVAALTDSPRLGILSVIVLFAVGMAFLVRVDDGHVAPAAART